MTLEMILWPIAKKKKKLSGHIPMRHTKLEATQTKCDPKCEQKTNTPNGKWKAN